MQVGALAWRPYSGQQLAVGCCNGVCLWSFGKCPAGGAPAQKVAVGGTFQTAWLSFLRTYQTGEPAKCPLVTEPQYLAYMLMPVDSQLDTTACETQPARQQLAEHDQRLRPQSSLMHNPGSGAVSQYRECLDVTSIVHLQGQWLRWHGIPGGSFWQQQSTTDQASQSLMPPQALLPRLLQV